ncbi:hypothetical protein REPUB_Repub13aG0001800 [Reevesia pubescens]
MGIGVAIRDFKGRVVALLSKKKQVAADPFIVECLSLKEALTFALEIGIRNVEIEGNVLIIGPEVKPVWSPISGSTVGSMIKINYFENYFRHISCRHHFCDHFNKISAEKYF